jgi:hypothetical protein
MHVLRLPLQSWVDGCREADLERSPSGVGRIEANRQPYEGESFECGHLLDSPRRSSGHMQCQVSPPGSATSSQGPGLGGYTLCSPNWTCMCRVNTGHKSRNARRGERQCCHVGDKALKVLSAAERMHSTTSSPVDLVRAGRRASEWQRLRMLWLNGADRCRVRFNSARSMSGCALPTAV